MKLHGFTRSHRQLLFNTSVGVRCAILVGFALFFNQSMAISSDNLGHAIVDHSDLGRELSDAELAQLQSQVFFDGEGLPAGTGNASEGATLYGQHCASCHGSAGQGSNSVELVGERELLSSDFPDKGIAVYWPYAPTLFGYIQRAMPPDKPNSFTASELYSLVAYVLHLNGLLTENATLDKTSLAKIKLPNHDGFIDKFDQ